ncbi:MAG: CDGSH iron-sulfur domain-containing protein [Crocinitomicaceae bacterium]|nr:CDGSH iron-sulfur domain-containing protein [Crocinitomicaceae bacterium]
MAVNQSKGPDANAQGPDIKTLTSGTTYAWCSCGQSDNQPWCNGAHRGSEKQPVVFKAESEKPVALCSCKKTKNPPFCDGSHAR